MTDLTKEQIEKLEKQQYRVVGNHSVVKICEWCKKSLRGEGVCYKQKFYGIKSHRCLQMSPALLCDQRCLFCWRDTSIFNSLGWIGAVDNPEEI
ncbi:MAG: 4-demethylwyosine synthase TYW1, partial [Candidatus Diapherotrites archaeon]|nr:4-demethylwyosine synthase TYW1 [Candidatus Diapherotrites archaeon]